MRLILEGHDPVPAQQEVWESGKSGKSQLVARSHEGGSSHSSLGCIMCSVPGSMTFLIKKNSGMAVSKMSSEGTSKIDYPSPSKTIDKIFFLLIFTF